MGAGIYILSADGLIELSPGGFAREDEFQDLLARFPRLLGGGDSTVGAERRWLLVTREIGVPDGAGAGGRWSLDHLFLDQDGIPTLVEVKRASDTRLRREVVGQMLDYAANAVSHWAAGAIQRHFEARCEREGLSPAEVLESFLMDGRDHAAYWHSVHEHLLAGRIRMIFVADAIPLELRRIVEFLNEQLDPAEVLALELRQFQDPATGMRGMAPRLYGQTAQAEQRKSVSTAGERWTEERFFPELARRAGESAVAPARAILDWAKSTADAVWWGQGRIDGSFFPGLGVGGRLVYPFAVWTYGKIELQFTNLRNVPGLDTPELRAALRERLSTIPGISFTGDGADRRPSFRLEVLAGERERERFLDCISECMRGAIGA